MVGSFYLVLTKGFVDFANAIAIFLPPISVLFLIAIILGSIVPSKQEKSATILQVFYTGVVGIGVGYVETILSEDFLKALLPTFITIIIILFQLVGRLRPDFEAPFDTRVGYTAAALGIIFFLVSAQYFQNTIDIGVPERGSDIEGS